MRWAGGDGRTDRSPAIAGASKVRGPLGFSRSKGAVLFSGERAQARQPGSSEPRGRQNVKDTLIYTHTPIFYPVVFCPWLGHRPGRLPDLATLRGRAQFPDSCPVSYPVKILTWLLGASGSSLVASASSDTALGHLDHFDLACVGTMSQITR